MRPADTMILLKDITLKVVLGGKKLLEYFMFCCETGLVSQTTFLSFLYFALDHYRVVRVRINVRKWV